MGLELKDRVVCGSKNGYGMAVGGMNPLDVVGWCEDCTGDGSFALVYLDAIASKDDQALRGSVRRVWGGEEC